MEWTAIELCNGRQTARSPPPFCQAAGHVSSSSFVSSFNAQAHMVSFKRRPCLRIQIILKINLHTMITDTPLPGGRIHSPPAQAGDFCVHPTLKTESAADASVAPPRTGRQDFPSWVRFFLALLFLLEVRFLVTPVAELLLSRSLHPVTQDHASFCVWVCGPETGPEAQGHGRLWGTPCSAGQFPRPGAARRVLSTAVHGPGPEEQPLRYDQEPKTSWVAKTPRLPPHGIEDPASGNPRAVKSLAPSCCLRLTLQLTRRTSSAGLLGDCV